MNFTVYAVTIQLFSEFCIMHSTRVNYFFNSVSCTIAIRLLNCNSIKKKFNCTRYNKNFRKISSKWIIRECSLCKCVSELPCGWNLESRVVISIYHVHSVIREKRPNNKVNFRDLFLPTKDLESFIKRPLSLIRLFQFIYEKT